MTALLLLLLALPLVATVICAVAPRAVGLAATVATGIVSLALVLALVPTTAHRTVVVAGWVRVDALSTVFMLATGFLYAVVAVYSVGYLAGEEHASPRDAARYERRFLVGFNVFAWSMLAAPMAEGLAILWICIEVTTVVSALLVALENTTAAAEAAWKYVLIASSGLGIALLATIFMYYAGSTVLGSSYDLGFAALRDHAAALPVDTVRLAFVLAVVGFGTKVGLFPVHTWLPDAHAEAPTPVSALLSGSLLAVSLYAILRFYQVTAITTGSAFPRRVLLVFGLLTLALAALSLLGQDNIKRFLAYSSIEHMGILAIGVSFGAPLALVGVLLHVLGHAAAKGCAFMGAGSVVQEFGTKQVARISAGINRLPWVGSLFLAALLALCGLPPFSLFRSEFMIVMGGIQSAHVVAAVLIVLVTIAFAGLLGTGTMMLFAPADSCPLPRPDSRAAPAAKPSAAWTIVPMSLGVLVLLVLGVHPPDVIMDLLSRGAAELGGSSQ